MAAFNHAAGAWFRDPSLALDAHLGRAFEALRRLSAGDDVAPGADHLADAPTQDHVDASSRA
jgi:hypothetical protein